MDWAVCAAAIIYTLSYLCVSRIGYAATDRLNLDVLQDQFFLIQPTSRHLDALNELAIKFYYPCILVDYYLGSGRWPAMPPLRISG